MRTLFISVIGLLIVASCDRPSHVEHKSTETAHKMQHASDYIDSSNLNLKDSATVYLDRIKQSGDTIMIHHANNILNARKAVDSVVEGIKRQLKSVSEADVGFPTHLMLSTHAGKDLTMALGNFYNTVCKAQQNSEDLHSVKDILSEESKMDRHWLKRYFENIPAIAAITLVTKLQNDCANATVFSFKQLAQGK